MEPACQCHRIKERTFGCIRTRHPQGARPVLPAPPPPPAPASREHLLRAPRSPRAAPPPPERGAGAAGPTPAAATQCGPTAFPPPQPLRQARGAHKSPPAGASPPGSAAHPPWAPAPGSRSVLVTAFQTWQPSRQSSSAADLLISAPRDPGPARPRRPPGWSGASGAAGRRASLHVAWLRARRAHRPIGRAPARRGAGLRSPRPLPPPHTRVGSLKRRRRGPAHPLTPSRATPPPAPPAGCAQLPGPGATWRPPCRGAGGAGDGAPEPRFCRAATPLAPPAPARQRAAPQSSERDPCHPGVPLFPAAQERKTPASQG